MDELGPAQAEHLIRAYLDAGRVKEAMVVSKRAIEAFAPGLVYRVLLAEGFEALGQRTRAVQTLETTLKIQPDYSPATRMLKRLRPLGH